MTSPEAALALAPYAGQLGRPLDAVATDLDSFSSLLLKWNAVQNLVSRETESTLWSRHISDSLQLLTLLRPADRTIVDLGSGGGLPALPLSIALKGSGTRVVMIEPIAKKVAFLRTVIRELALDAIVMARRAEDVDSRETGPVDVVTSRALAPLPALLGLAFPFFGPTTRALLHKGREHVDEVAESHLVWEHHVIIHPSATASAGVILEVSALRPKRRR